jgi:hypothetical protein
MRKSSAIETTKANAASESTSLSVLAISTNDYKLKASTNIITVPGIAKAKYSPMPLNVYVVGLYQASAKSGHLDM